MQDARPVKRRRTARVTLPDGDGLRAEFAAVNIRPQFAEIDGLREPVILAGALAHLPDSADWMNLAHTWRPSRELIGHFALARRRSWAEAKSALAFINANDYTKPARLKPDPPIPSGAVVSDHVPSPSAELRRTWINQDYARNNAADDATGPLVVRILAARSADALDGIAEEAEHLRGRLEAQEMSAEQRADAACNCEQYSVDAIIASALPISAYSRALKLVNFTGLARTAHGANGWAHRSAELGNAEALQYFSAMHATNPETDRHFYEDNPEPLLHKAVRSGNLATLEVVARMPNVDLGARNEDLIYDEFEEKSPFHVAIDVDNMPAFRRLFELNDAAFAMDAPAEYIAACGKPGRLTEVLDYPATFGIGDVHDALMCLIRDRKIDDFDAACNHPVVRRLYSESPDCNRLVNHIIVELLAHDNGERAGAILDAFQTDINKMHSLERPLLSAVVVAENSGSEPPHYPVLEKILARGDADMHIRDDAGETALSLAISKGDPEMVRRLLAYRRSDFGAARTARSGLDAHVPLFARTADGANILHLLAKSESDPENIDRMAELLFVQRGVTGLLNIPDNNGERVLHSAVRRGNLRLVQRILADPDIEISAANATGESPLHAALAAYGAAMRYSHGGPGAASAHGDCVDLLLRDGRLQFPATPAARLHELAFAALHGHGNAVRALLQAVPTRDVYKAAPLRTPFENAWETAVARSVDNPESVDVVRAFTECGKLDPNRLTINGQHPLRAIKRLGPANAAVGRRIADCFMRNWSMSFDDMAAFIE